MQEANPVVSGPKSEEIFLEAHESKGLLLYTHQGVATLSIFKQIWKGDKSARTFRVDQGND